MSSSPEVTITLVGGCRFVESISSSALRLGLDRCRNDFHRWDFLEKRPDVLLPFVMELMVLLTLRELDLRFNLCFSVSSEGLS